ncbi:MAG: nicotinamide riboside transporter PnuC [Armatimonadetes bacterium]|nr:nicotinamide riboside transporter PnuC [Armatimonadota bacterium]
MKQKLLGLSLRFWRLFFWVCFVISLYFSYRETPFTWVTGVEVFAVITGAVCVWLAIIEHIANWFVAILSSVAYIVLFRHSRLYSDMGLQVVYVVLGLWGWYNWLYGGRGHGELGVTRTPKREWLLLWLAGLFGTALLWRVNLFFNGAAPFWDACLTAFSLVAQYMITRKYIENWMLWILVDAIYVPLYLSRKLYPTAVLYALFVGLAIMGWQEWRTSYEKTALERGSIEPV